jgi:hypothetical protein
MFLIESKVNQLTQRSHPGTVPIHADRLLGPAIARTRPREYILVFSPVFYPTFSPYSHRPLSACNSHPSSNLQV